MTKKRVLMSDAEVSTMKKLAHETLEYLKLEYEFKEASIKHYLWFLVKDEIPYLKRYDAEYSCSYCKHWDVCDFKNTGCEFYEPDDRLLCVNPGDGPIDAIDFGMTIDGNRIEGTIRGVEVGDSHE